MSEPLIDIRPDHLEIVLEILKKYVPEHEVWAFGSRATWKAKEYSDLDLCIVTDKPLSFKVLGSLEEDFVESDLPWKVDVVDWATTSESFRGIIEKDKVVVQKMGRGGVMAGEESTIGALLDETDGSIKTGPFGTKLKASEYTATGVPVISVGEVGLGRLRIHHDTPRVDETVSSRMPEFLLQAGDIVFGRKGAVERSAQVQPNEDGYFLGSDGIRIRLNIESCDPKFISYQLQTTAHRSWMIQHAAGTTMPSLNEGIIRRIPIILKPLQEQRAIASLLGTLDDKIDLNRRMNEDLEAMARLFFKDWFVDFGPTRAKAEGLPPYLVPELWELFPDALDDDDKPMGWVEKRVEDVLELSYGKALKADERITGSVPVYGSGGITGYHNEYLVIGSSVVVGRKGTVGSLYWEDRPFFPIDTVFYVKPKAPLTFCYYLLQTLALDGMNTDAAVPGLNRNNVYRLPVTWSCERLLEAFDGIIKPLRTQIFSNTKESNILSKTRDILLPKLMSGEIRLREAEKMVEQAL